MSAEGGEPVELPADFSPEHMVLAGLLRCSRASLEYHARRAGISVTRLNASADARVTKREDDSRYAFVEVLCRFSVTLEPRPDEDALAALLMKTERDCFVGASFQVP